MNKLVTILGVLALIGAGCSSSAPAEDVNTPDAVPALSSDVKQIKDTFETLEIAAQTGHCDSFLLNIAPSAGATETDCDAILAFAKSHPLVALVDWPATELNGKTGKLYRADGSLVMNLQYDDSGMLWGYKISDKFWK